MDTQQLATIAAQLRRARLTAVSLYAYAGGLYASQEYNRLIAGIAGGELLLAEVARLRTELDGAREAQAQAERARDAERAARARAEGALSVMIEDVGGEVAIATGDIQAARAVAFNVIDGETIITVVDL